MRDFAAAEDRLNKEFRAKIEATEKRLREDTEQHDAQLASELTALVSEFESAGATAETRYTRRVERLTVAKRASHKLSAKRIDDEEGNWKYKSQKGMLDTKRYRTEALAQNDATLAEFHQQLAGNRAAFVALEQSTDAAFRGYGKFRQWLAKSENFREPDLSADEHGLLEQLQSLHTTAEGNLTKFRKLFLPKLFRALPLWLWIGLILVCGGGLIPLLPSLGYQNIGLPHIGGGAGALVALMTALYFMGRSQAAALAGIVAGELESARRLHDACLQKSQARHAAEIERIEAEAKHSHDMFQQNWTSAVEQAERARELWPAKIDEKWRRAWNRTRPGTPHVSRKSSASGRPPCRACKAKPPPARRSSPRLTNPSSPASTPTFRRSGRSSRPTGSSRPSRCWRPSMAPTPAPKPSSRPGGRSCGAAGSRPLPSKISPGSPVLKWM